MRTGEIVVAEGWGNPLTVDVDASRVSTADGERVVAVTATTTSGRPSTSGVPARGLSDKDRARRGVDHAKSYRLGLRIADNVHGWIDSSHHQDQELESLPWAQRLQRTYIENSDRVLTGTRDVLVDRVAQMEAVYRRVLSADEAFAALSARPFTPLERARAHGEKHLADEAVRERVGRVNSVRRAAAEAEVDAARANRDALVNQCGELVATILEEFTMAEAIVVRMQSFYMRRVMTYARRLSRRREDLSLLRFELAVPVWVGQPCPWVAPAIMERLGDRQGAPLAVLHALRK